MTAPQHSSPAAPVGPGFVVVILDIPFALGLPNATFTVFDPVKQLAIVQVVSREGSRAFFRNRPIIGPTSFAELAARALEYQRPRQDYSYVATSVLPDGEQKATLNVHCGIDGGFAEAKYYSEVHVTFIEQDLRVISTNEYVLGRATSILNPFLDKYRLLAEDYRVGHVAADRNYYLAACHTSPFLPGEATLSIEQLLQRLTVTRTFHSALGQGGANILRTNSLDYLGPHAYVGDQMLHVLAEFARTQYELPLSYDLILQALRALQIDRDAKLAIVHAATAVEVHVLHLLHRILVALGRDPAEAWRVLETDSQYEGISRRLNRLEAHTKDYCDREQSKPSAFVGTTLFNRWRDVLARKRNRAVHAGIDSFTWHDGAEAIGIAKEVIVFLDNRVPALSNHVRLNPSIEGMRESAGGILF